MDHIDIVMYRDYPQEWNGFFVENPRGELVKVGKWLPSDDDERRVYRIQADEISNA